MLLRHPSRRARVSLDRPVLAVLCISLMLVIGLFAAIYGFGFFGR